MTYHRTHPGVSRLALLTIVLAVAFASGRAWAQNDAAIINPKFQIYTSDATDQKIALRLLQLEAEIADEDLLISEAVENTGLATVSTFDDRALLVDVITSTAVIFNDAFLAEFNSETVTVRDSFPEYYRLTLAVTDLESLHTIAARPDVMQVKAQYQPRHMSGSVDNLADAAMSADLVRDQYGIDGFGQKVGILSDSFARTTEETTPHFGWVRQSTTRPIAGFPGNLISSLPQESGDLPATVELLRDDFEDGIDEGAAMGELIYDIAPGAALAFHTSEGGEAVLAKGFRRLCRAGCTVIVDDTLYPDEPMYQNGLASRQASGVVNDFGISVVSAAGNFGAQGIRWTYRDIDPNNEDSTSPAALRQGRDLNDWGDGNPFLPITLGPGASFQVLMQWNQPFASLSPGGGAQIDLDLYVLEDTDVRELNESFETPPLAWARDGQGLTGLPLGDAFEMQDTVYTNDTSNTQVVYLVVDHFQGRRTSIPQSESTPIEFRLVFWKVDGEVTIPFPSSTMFGHAVNPNVISVGSVAVEDAPLCYSGTPQEAVPEPDTSLGGALRLMFTEDGDFSLRTVLAPTLAGLDAVETSFFGDGEFFGTSAAAANVAGVVALVRQANFTRGPGQVAALLGSTACDVAGEPATAGRDAWSGAGVPDALQAVDAVRPGVNLTLTNLGDLEDRLIASVDPTAFADDTEFTTADEIFVNFAVMNTGTVTPRGRMQAQLFVDDKPLRKGRRVAGKFQLEIPEPGGFVSLDEGFSLGMLPAGPHTIRVEITLPKKARELNRTDNVYSKTIVVQQE